MSRPGAGVFLALGLLGLVAGCSGKKTDVELLNASYDPTRELYQELNQTFAAGHLAEHGKTLNVEMSHGGSSSQARSVIDGLDADIVSLALWSDIDAIRSRGLIGDDWQERLPNRSLPYSSTIVFVVRKGNPKGIKDWQDLVATSVEIITPNPRTSGNGQLTLLAAWGSVLHGGGSDEAAEKFVTQLYRQVPVLDSGARGATTTFAQKKIGDVLLAWENEALLEVEKAKGELEVVYPSASIKAEPFVAVVDANVDRRGTRAAAEAYLRSLYTKEAQEVIAKHYYRPCDAAVLKRHEATLKPIPLFEVTLLAPGGWGEAQKKFFASGGVFDRVEKNARTGKGS